MSLSLKRVVVSLQAIVAIVSVLGLGACSRDQHVTDSLTGVAREGLGPFRNGLPGPPPPVPGANFTLTSLKLAPAAVAGGASSVGTVDINNPAPAAGAMIALASSNAGLASVPATVLIAAGAKRATFPVATTVPATNSSAVITASLNGISFSATLAVAAPALASVALAPASVFAGGPSQGTITLTAAAVGGGALVTLSSGNPALVGIPATVLVAGGATSATFAITTTPSAVGAGVIVTGTYLGVAKTATLAVAASDPCASLTNLGGAAVLASGRVPQFRTGRLRVDLVGDVAGGWLNAMGACTASDTPSDTFVSGSGDVTLAGTNTSITSAGGPLTFGPLLLPGLVIEPGVVISTDAAGNVLQIIWPALAGLPAGPPVLRMNLASWSPAAQTGAALDATMTFNARNLNGSTATFTARGTNMVIPTFIP